MCACVLFFCSSCIFNLLAKALLKALVYAILRFNCKVMDVVSVVAFYLVIISSSYTTN